MGILDFLFKNIGEVNEEVARKEKQIELIKRYFIFACALFISALGVSVITRSSLGTSPISGVPFVLSNNTSLSMGTYIFILNMALIVGQMLMLGKKGILERKIDLAMQIPISVVFGLFIDLTMQLLDGVIPDIYAVKVVSLVIGCAILALGICFEVVADVTMVSGEYFVQIASKRFKKEFGFVKIAFDISLVILAIIFSLALAGQIDGVREGTIIAALVTGPFVRLISPNLRFIERWEVATATTATESQAVIPATSTIITISREYGSGGHLIGEQIAKDLGIKFYDKELIKLVAAQSGMSEQLVSEKEQQMPSRMLYEMIMKDYEAPLEKSLSADDALFVAQSRVIRQVASEGACVIVGRCADYILSECADCINIFLHSDSEHKIERAVSEYGLTREKAAIEVERINRAREQHYFHFTGKHWGETRNYHLTCDTGVMSEAQVCSIIESLYNEK